MRVRRLDSQGDWTFGNGRGNYAAASDCLAQRVKTRLRSFRGNWFLDLDHGLPWLELMERPADLVHLEHEVKRCILSTEGVSRLTAFSMALEADTRTLTIQVTLLDVEQQAMTVSTTV
ncbi:hypothetical protein D1605_005180 [Xylella fastidiosa subsp. fastidiosa]|uniref:Phage-related protein n=1 Tax=Xylella fastidiosa (strain M23) TaxID=405441 RepID=B2I501_XYLF2|nr:hypothetical protein [Xylella fastidiosa]ACB92446.1 conserved hypothetical protein [Xylella fastidiosa M23]MBE0263366.1 hypothetical protein [Xylella fastidiosa subsp. fastidiosa]MBE0265564.1 hypothetical protein [Xylella fastidiosa subsp. fastidiosa]MBE0267767.1 hypothetical protein [Xylella fastidiosa subsp. fastidiosa]MBE0272170.1 hypothetical protein [Xylella fastidiosa subsp. fastidiosa]